MSEKTLRELYQKAEQHAEAGRGPSEEYLPTIDDLFDIGGDKVHFHIDNSPAIYYDIREGGDDLVYVKGYEDDLGEGVHPSEVVTEDQFVDRVQQMLSDANERLEGNR